MIILDTDHLGQLQHRTSVGGRQLDNRLHNSFDAVATTIVSAEEQMCGWLAKIHGEKEATRQIKSYERLDQLFKFFAGWTILPWDEAACDVFAHLKNKKVCIGTMDLKIASIALANDAILLSRNRRDFDKVPQLHVEDWLS